MGRVLRLRLNDHKRQLCKVSLRLIMDQRLARYLLAAVRLVGSKRGGWMFCERGFTDNVPYVGEGKV